MAYIALVPSILVDDVWIQAVPHFAHGEEHWAKFYTLPEIKENCIWGRQQLWLMLDNEAGKVLGVALTQLDTYKFTKAFRIVFVGGTGGWKRTMIHELDKMELWAKRHGAKFVDFLGRDAWERQLKAIGYYSPGRVYRKAIA